MVESTAAVVKEPDTKWMLKACLGAIGGSIAFLSVMSAPFLLVPASKKLGSLPWMATPVHTIRRALTQVQAIQGPTTAKRTMVDLGAGDGRLCITAAKEYGYSALGLELNPVLVGLSYYNAWKAGRIQAELAQSGRQTAQFSSIGSVPTSTVLSQVRFQMKDFWSVSLSSFDVITVFGVRSIMARLESKLSEEAQKEVIVVCYRFPMPTKQPVYAQDELFIYRFGPSSMDNVR